jgi:hypothetical protein
MSRLQKKPPAHKRGHPTLKNMHFFYFCGSFLPSWIRIRIRIQITDPMVRLNTDPDPKPCQKHTDQIRIRIRNTERSSKNSHKKKKCRNPMFRKNGYFLISLFLELRFLQLLFFHYWSHFSLYGPTNLLARLSLK